MFRPSCSSWMRARRAAAWRSRSSGDCCSRSSTDTVRMMPLIGRRGLMLAEQLEEAGPRRGVHLAVRLLGGVAPGRVEQHRLVGEPPVAVARAADAADGAGAEALRQRKLQAGIDQRGGLARTRRADEDVPGQLVQILAAAEQATQARLPGGSAEPGGLELGQRFLETLAQGFHFLGGGGGLRRSGRRRAAQQAVHHLGIDALRLEHAPQLLADEDEDDERDQHQPRPLRLQRPPRGEGQQRTEEPDHRRQGEQADDGEQDRVEENAQDLLHADVASLCGTGGKVRRPCWRRTG